MRYNYFKLVVSYQTTVTKYPVGNSGDPLPPPPSYCDIVGQEEAASSSSSSSQCVAAPPVSAKLSDGPVVHNRYGQHYSTSSKSVYCIVLHR